ncbi:hypothetical protein PanWU01x14_283610 [Parasponia andersonii]|uniref:Uncharacterized protein n=1 Tax=Parasponia andersonii TaxID=3476 RepID=A0A2P5B0D6_PARAD|nr:hypothetical protein PanWU01x14_283610 [Parasponia andersonii]
MAKRLQTLTEACSPETNGGDLSVVKPFGFKGSSSQLHDMKYRGSQRRAFVGCLGRSRLELQHWFSSGG